MNSDNLQKKRGGDSKNDLFSNYSSSVSVSATVLRQRGKISEH